MPSKLAFESKGWSSLVTFYLYPAQVSLYGMRWEMLRLRPDAPENGATGGSAANFNTTLSNIQIATPQVTVGYSSSSLEGSREASSVDSSSVGV